MKKVGIVMGSDSDLPVVEKAISTLKEYGVPCEVHVYSAHRTPVQAKEFAENAVKTDSAPLLQLPVRPRIWPALWRRTPRCRYWHSC